MTEYNSFNGSYLKNMCRACLQAAKEVFPMNALEINTYQSFTREVTKMAWDMNLCLICKWMLHRCRKFTEQCRKANEILSQDIKMNSKSNLFLQVPTAYDLKIYRVNSQYVGPETSLHSNEEKEEFIEMNDPIIYDDDEDDEMPLVMLQEDYKNKKGISKIYESSTEPEIKQEPEVKEEYTQDSYSKRRKKKKKEIKEGFSSRMVQETDEYVVIKLTKEEVLSAMAEKAKTDSYLRSPYKCDKCIKGFNFEDVLQTHMEKHSMEHGKFQCDICTQYCPNPVSLRGHLKSHTTRYQCKLCGQVRLSRQHLLEHHAITHTAAPTTYWCDKCQFTTNKRTVIQRHVKTHATNERHACHRCGKLFNTIETLRVHTMRHDKSKRLQCEHCDKHFIYPSLLHKHILAVHERKDYYCVECDVRFKSPESLRLHFKKAKRHRDSSSYRHECPQCPQRFVTTASLAVHLTSAHGVAKQYSCSLCHRLYSSRDTLRAHAWRVHSDPTKESKSTLKGTRSNVLECGAAFTQKASMKMHQASDQHQKQDLNSSDVAPRTSVPQED